MGTHSNQTIEDGIHIIQAYEFDNISLLDSAIFTSTDVGKVVRLLDTNDFYIIKSEGSGSLTYEQIASGAAGGDLDGYFPNPNVVDLTITNEEQGSVLYFDGSNWVQLAPGTSGNVLTTQGAGADPTWGTNSTNPIGNAGGDLGGTYPNPEVNDLTITNEEQGSILYFNGSNWVHLAPGDDGYVLTSHGSGANPTWDSHEDGEVIGVSSASFTFDASLANKYVRTTSASAQEGTIPNNTSVSHEVGTLIVGVQAGVGQLTIAAGSGVTLNKPTGKNANLRTQFSSFAIKKVGINEWDLTGDLEDS